MEIDKILEEKKIVENKISFMINEFFDRTGYHLDIVRLKETAIIVDEKLKHLYQVELDIIL